MSADVRHCDNTCDAGRGPLCNGRRLTGVYYPNTGWDAAAGGELRVWPRAAAATASGSTPPGVEPLVDVEPHADRLILFFADIRVPHEVLPSFRERFAITLWYFDSPERQAALAKERDEVDVSDFIKSSLAQHGGQVGGVRPVA